MIEGKLRSKLTYKGPLALYIAYCILLLLSISLIVMLFPLDVEGPLFIQILITGVIGLLVSGSLVLYSTQIVRRIDPLKWKKNSDRFYNDEGDFLYTFSGFKIETWNSGPLDIQWKDIVKIESHQRKIDRKIKITCIDIYFSDKNFISINSSISGFNLFEKKLRENLDHVWKGSLSSSENKDKILYTKESISNS